MIAAIVLIASAVVQLPAAASNGSLSSTLRTSNGGGAYASLKLVWTGQKSYDLRSVYLNDRCNAKGKGDGKTAIAVFWIKRNQQWMTSGETWDVGGCTSAPWRQKSHPWFGVSRIDSFGLQVCAGSTSNERDRVCDPVIHERVNVYH